MLDWLWQGIQGIVNGLGNMIDKLVDSLNFEDVLSSIVGIIPRSIAFLRSLVSPLGDVVTKVFGSGVSEITGVSYVNLLFYAVIGFIVALGFRRGVTG